MVTYKKKHRNPGGRINQLPTAPGPCGCNRKEIETDATQCADRVAVITEKR